MWYSVTYGEVAIIALSTEHNFASGSAQQEWLVQELQLHKSARWRIVLAHRPFYCTHSYEDCNGFAARLRISLEQILKDNDVHLVISGHLHQYERTMPVFQESHQPQSPVYTVVGSAGGVLQEGDWLPLTEDTSWSAYRSSVPGYGRISIHNQSSLHFEFVETATQMVLDDFWIRQ